MNDIILLAMPEEAPSLVGKSNVFYTGVGKVNAAIVAATYSPTPKPMTTNIQSELLKPIYDTDFTESPYQSPFKSSMKSIPFEGNFRPNIEERYLTDYNGETLLHPRFNAVEISPMDRTGKSYIVKNLNNDLGVPLPILRQAQYIASL